MDYNNNKCCNKYFHLATKFESNGKLIITVKNAEDICDKEPFYFRLCDCPPVLTKPLQIFITVNGVSVPLEDKFGNYLYSNQLKTRKVYCGAYGANPAHVIAFNETGF